MAVFALVEATHSVQFQKISLSDGKLDEHLYALLNAYEEKDFQFGEAWLRNLTETALSTHEQAVIYTVRLPDNSLLACPMKLDSRNGQGHALGTFYTSLFSVLTDSNNAGLLFRELLNYLLREERLTAVTFSPMDPDTLEFNHLQQAIEDTGWKGAHNYFCFGNWIHTVEEPSADAYFLSRPSKLRNTVSRRTRKFLDQGRGQLKLVQDPVAVEDAITDFVSVYNKSWKLEEPFPEFVPELIRLAARRGWLRLGIAYYDDKPVASQIWVVANHTASIFKLAYDEAYKKSSPGTVLTAFMMKHAIEIDAVTCIDYLSGDDGYKKDWMSQRRERRGLAAYNPRTLRGCMLLVAHILKRQYKKWFSANSNNGPS